MQDAIVISNAWCIAVFKRHAINFKSQYTASPFFTSELWVKLITAANY